MLFIICTGEKKKKKKSEGVFIGHPGKGVSFTSSVEGEETSGGEKSREELLEECK